MKYYLDTNVLYNIHKIPASLKPHCFYSSYGLSEIISGITETNFNKRKIALQRINDSGIICDPKMWEQLFLEGFTYFNDYDFLDNRFEHLSTVVKDVMNSQDFAHFSAITMSQEKQDILQYFIDSDRFYSDNFRRASVEGLSKINALRKDHKNKSISIDNDTPGIQKKEDLIDMLDDDNINNGITQMVFAGQAQKMSGIDGGEETEKEIFNSYNGLLDIYIKGYSFYSRRQMKNNFEPGKNDNQDLMHLHYLRNGISIKMVSDDKLFHQCIPTHIISFDGLLSMSE